MSQNRKRCWARPRDAPPLPWSLFVHVVDQLRVDGLHPRAVATRVVRLPHLLPEAAPSPEARDAAYYCLRAQEAIPSNETCATEVLTRFDAPRTPPPPSPPPVEAAAGGVSPPPAATAAGVLPQEEQDWAMHILLVLGGLGVVLVVVVAAYLVYTREGRGIAGRRPVGKTRV